MAREQERAKARNMVLLADGAPPEWVELIPSGHVSGRDGREWTNDDPDGIVAAFQHHAGPLPIDWEHASEHKAPKGEEAPAAGWISALENRAGAIWGKVDWTPRAAAQIAAKEYRFLSPVFLYARNKQLSIQALCSAGLTNQPNLPLVALNAAEGLLDSQEVPMKRVLEALGLKAEATEEEALSALQALQGDLKSAKAANQASPSLDKYVPRGDYDAVVAKAANAERRLAEQAKAQAEAAIETAIGEALKAGKITPATAEYHKAQCRTEGGLARFQEYVKAAPAVGAGSGLDGKQPGGQTKALNAEQQAVCTALGIPEQEFVKSMEVN